jgi:hypothetical protein
MYDVKNLHFKDGGKLFHFFGNGIWCYLGLGIGQEWKDCIRRRWGHGAGIRR